MVGTLTAEPTLDTSQPDLIEDCDFFITYPRSGRNWTVAILQIVLNKPVKGCKHPEMREGLGKNRLKLELDEGQKPLYCSHFPYGFLKEIDPKKNKLLTIIRNPKECLVRHKRYNAKRLYHSVLTDSGGFKHYIENLALFDQWDCDETKLLVYYEDLITKPKEVIYKVLTFLGENPERSQDFFAHYDYWRQRVLESYQNNTKPNTSSGGDKLLYHSKDFPTELLHEIDLHIQTRYPTLWTRYLSRYMTR